MKITFISNKFNQLKHNNLLITPNYLYFVTLHLKFSSLFFSTQLIDIFAYDLPFSSKKHSNVLLKQNSQVVVYNFHSILTHNRIFLFVLNLTSKSYLKYSVNSVLPSITELFPGANWLEREVSELSGIHFLGKKDLRNLMLQYGDLTTPFQKSFPTIGIKEVLYDPIKDTVVQTPLTVQL